jgi:hypothetical protein
MILAKLWIVRHEFTISEFGTFDRLGMYVICYFWPWPVHHKWILDKKHVPLLQHA